MPRTKKWTLMFYFASDNPLAPGVISQLKSIKQAGFHPEANVIARFVPEVENAPAQIFDVNIFKKLKADGKPKIGITANDPFVPNLVSDRLWGEQGKGLIRMSLNENGYGGRRIKYDPPVPPPRMSREKSPEQALSNFLRFCRENYPARRYMLFILGHGLIVGNDVFLFDAHAKQHSLSLEALGGVLRRFKQKLDAEDAKFDLVSFHSCSMSGLEVAYELQDTAEYMLASQSPAFVGSWPYRQILIRVFNDLVKRRANVKETLKKIFSYCLHNSDDFQMAGYSFDVSLCDLNKVREIKAPLQHLSEELIKALADRLARERILLAHLEAQSFWQENYTDLYDFCFCLKRRCEGVEPASEKTRATLEAMRKACDAVTRVLKSGDNKLIVSSGFTGPAYQYSHGLSVFFPWSKPANRRFWPKEYRGYKFDETSWRKFLDQYFEMTMRVPRGSESHSDELSGLKAGLKGILLDAPSSVFNGNGQPGMGGVNQMLSGARVDTLGQAGARDPLGNAGARDPTGDDCGCPSIKNYPPYTSVPAGVKLSRRAGTYNSSAARIELAPTPSQPHAYPRRSRKDTNGTGSGKPGLDGVYLGRRKKS